MKYQISIQSFNQKIDQCGRIRVAAEIFGSVLAPRYKKNSHILAKFIQSNNLIELFPG